MLKIERGKSEQIIQTRVLMNQDQQINEKQSKQMSHLIKYRITTNLNILAKWMPIHSTVSLRHLRNQTSQ